MSHLLISVRNLTEALQAREAGADIVDLKEPALGSLSAVQPHVRREVAGAWSRLDSGARRPPLSAALGELLELQELGPESSDWSQLTELHYVKVGLAGTAGLSNWTEKWLDFKRRLPANCALVAAAYADAAAARSAQPGDVLQFAIHQGVNVFLLDTWDKSRGHVFKQIDWNLLQEMRELARGRLQFVLAGSLRLEDERLLAQLQPDIVAVRGAVCEGGRGGNLCPRRLAQWRALADRC